MKHSLLFCVIVVVYWHESWFDPVHYHHLISGMVPIVFLWYFLSILTCWFETLEGNHTNLLERQGDTPVLLWPGVKIEDDCLLLLLTPMCINIALSYIGQMFSGKNLTSPPSALRCSYPPTTRAPPPPNLLIQRNFWIFPQSSMRFLPVTISISITTILVSSFAPMYWWRKLLQSDFLQV